jgi:uncharacterized protein YciI
VKLEKEEVLMFVVIVSYIQPLDVVDDHLAAHVRFLKRHYENGVFLASGRQMPRTGGVILARAASKEALLEILHQDPFHEHGVARYEVIEFNPSMAAPGLEWLIEA